MNLRSAQTHENIKIHLFIQMVGQYFELLVVNSLLSTEYSKISDSLISTQKGQCEGNSGSITSLILIEKDWTLCPYLPAMGFN